MSGHSLKLEVDVFRSAGVQTAASGSKTGLARPKAADFSLPEVGKARINALFCPIPSQN
jgi:hypothetical protein